MNSVYNYEYNKEIKDKLKAMINDKILLLKNFFSQKTADGKC